MKKDMNDLKKLVNDLMDTGIGSMDLDEEQSRLMRKIYDQTETRIETPVTAKPSYSVSQMDEESIEDTEEIVEESLSLVDKEIELINKALKKHGGKRKMAAQELGISERTLYRKIKEYDIEE